METARNPEEHIKREFTRAARRLTSFIDAQLTQAPTDSNGQEVTSHYIPRHITVSRVEGESFSPMPTVAGISLSKEAPAATVPLRENYLWGLKFHLESGFADVMQANGDSAELLCVIHSTDVDQDGLPLQPHGFIEPPHNEIGFHLNLNQQSIDYLVHVTDYLEENFA